MEKNNESLIDVKGYWIVDPELYAEGIKAEEYNDKMRFDGKVILLSDGSFKGIVYDFENLTNPYLIVGKIDEVNEDTPQLIMNKISSVGLPTVVFQAEVNHQGYFNGKYDHFEDGYLIPGPGLCLIQIIENTKFKDQDLFNQINMVRRDIALFIERAPSEAIELMNKLTRDPYLLLSMPVYKFDSENIMS